MLALKRPFNLKNAISFAINWLQLNWRNIFMCSLLIYLLVAKNITLELRLNNDFLTGLNKLSNNKATNLNNFAIASLPINKTHLSIKQKEQLKYVNRFAEVAQNEMKKYGIPASITLAQGLLESNAGKSLLVTQNNNHFGIKCFSKRCKKGHCSNYSDDSHKDFFRNYKTAWDSYRAHSEFLSGNRYKHLLKETNYKVWANGLVKAGYATDPSYGKKLINLIERLELHQFDK